MSDGKIEVFNLNVHSIDLKSITDKMQKAFEKGLTFEDVIYDKDFKLKLVMLDYEKRSGKHKHRYKRIYRYCRNYSIEDFIIRTLIKFDVLFLLKFWESDRINGTDKVSCFRLTE